jgi:hypothetical protein
MALTTGNIKLLKSERLTDFDDGGGKMTANEVVDGVLNNVFADVSRLDKTYGRASLRKIFAKVDSPTLDTYYGSHAALVDPPDDLDISVTMFKGTSYADERKDAQDKVESYITASIESRFRLYGNHLAGQRQLQVFCKVDVAPPNIGDTFALQRYLTASVDELTPLQETQFVRIKKITSNSIEEFEEPTSGAPLKYNRRILTMDISTGLQSLFPGTQPTYIHGSSAKTKVHSTNAFDVSAYYGVSKVAVAATAGSYTVKVADVYAQIVPAATSEDPFVDIPALEFRAGLVAIGDADSVNVPLGAFVANQTRNVTLPTGIKPETLSISNAGAGVSRDDGLGGFSAAGITAKIDYIDGTLQVTTDAGYSSGALLAKYTPAVSPVVNASTALLPVTVTNRGFNYILTLKTLPARGSFFVEYRAQNRWYRLYDNGNGNIVGEQTSIGSGSVNYVTGSVLVTLGALPDLDTSLIYGWGSLEDIEKVSGTVAAPRPAIIVYLQSAFPPAQANGISVSATVGGVVKTAVSDANGNFNANGITGGYAGYSNNAFYPSCNVILDFLPDTGTNVVVTYTGVNNSNSFKSGTIGAASTDISGYSITLPTGVRSNTLRLSVPLAGDWADSWAGAEYAKPTENVAFRDDGTGNLLVEGTTTPVVGSVNYTTGAVSFNSSARAIVTKSRPAMLVQQWFAQGPQFGGGDSYQFKWKAPVTEAVTHKIIAANSLGYSYSQSSVATQTINQTMAVPPITLQLPKPAGKGQAIKSSLAFEFNSKFFFAKENLIYTNFDDATGLGVVAGNVDYKTYTVTLNVYGPGGATAIPTPVLKSLAIKNTNYDRFVSSANFRLPVAPVRPGSVIVKGVAADGSSIVGTSDVNGNITGTNIFGKVDQSSGVVSVVFGTQQTTTPTLQGQSWYATGTAGSGSGSEYLIGATSYVAVPKPVNPSTVTVSGIGLVSIPLDPLILGMDPVRLPVDGRGIIFRVGDVAVISNRGYETLPNPLTANQVVNLPRGGLSQVVLRDQNRTRVGTNQYAVNLTTGAITMASGLSLVGLTQPLIAEHVQDDISLVVDVLISGEIKLSKALVNSYAANTSYVSSALIFGDLQARVRNVFDQDVWDSVWRDVVSGASAPASYNTVSYPVEVRNDGCISQRWALVFTNATTFNVIGEDVGVLGSYSTASVCAPVNPLTSQPYFTIQPQGWGTGWVLGNVLRLETVGALAAIWLLRTTKQGPITNPTDSVKLQIRGDGE